MNHKKGEPGSAAIAQRTLSRMLRLKIYRIVGSQLSRLSSRYERRDALDGCSGLSSTLRG
jgi:hypothetical protein